MTERSKLRVQNFLADLETRLSEDEFVAGDRFTVADITALVTVDFAAKALRLPIPPEHAASVLLFDAVSARPSMAA